MRALWLAALLLSGAAFAQADNVSAPTPTANPVPVAPGLKLETVVPEIRQEMAPRSLEPVEVVDLFHQSLAEGFTEKALSLLAADAVIYETGYEEHGSAQYALGHVQEDAVFAGGSARKITRRESWQEGGVAWVLTQAEVRGQFGEKKIALAQTETMILRKTGEGWRISHVHWSAHTPEN